MIFFKACPKCQGDLYLDRDVYGVFVKCVQCAMVRDTNDRKEALSVTPAKQ